MKKLLNEVNQVLLLLDWKENLQNAGDQIKLDTCVIVEHLKSVCVSSKVQFDYENKSFAMSENHVKPRLSEI